MKTKALALPLAVTLAVTASGLNWHPGLGGRRPHGRRPRRVAGGPAAARRAAHRACQLPPVGPDPADRTIGDYLSGLLAAMEQPSNTVQARCEPGPGKHRACTVWLKHRDDEERWAWGLALEIDARHRPLAERRRRARPTAGSSRR